VSVRDVADAAAAVLRDPTASGATFTLTGPADLTFDDIATSRHPSAGCRDARWCS
jgi:uncharacterized protein YbjT (DUF2867 family)